ncbi:hypothetical protein D0Y65_034974 [Glycine soja]|uniref:Uncharacterized protein n=1 Tax=Glycine soja TaxID=3848 RepID=A0A445HT26_GLYSO|nr:hypothetical protein D0Y65_034974 [Glycine soja]
MATVSSLCAVFPILTPTLSKPHLAPLSCRIPKRRRISIITSVAEDREIVPVSEGRGTRLNEVEGFQPSEPHTESEVVVSSLTSSSSVNAIIVLGFGTFAVTKLLTIDHDYWHCYEGKPLFEFDRTRVLRSGLVGFTLHGSLSHYYYQLCEALFPFQEWWVVPAKVAFDQTVWSAIWNSIYFVVLGLLRFESLTNIYGELKSTFLPLLTQSEQIESTQSREGGVPVNVHCGNGLVADCPFGVIETKKGKGRVETLAFCASDYLWCDSCGTKASLGGLCGAHLGHNTFNVAIQMRNQKLEYLRQHQKQGHPLQAKIPRDKQIENRRKNQSRFMAVAKSTSTSAMNRRIYQLKVQLSDLRT